MKIYSAVAVTSTDTGYANAKVKLLKSFEDAQKFANREIDNYARQYQGRVTDRTKLYYIMKSDLMTVKIRIEEHEL